MSLRFGIMTPRLVAEGEELFRRAAALGLDLEWVPAGDPAQDLLLDPDSRRRVAAMARAHGVSIVSGALSGMRNTPPQSPDESLRSAGVAALKNWTAIYSEVGATMILYPLFDRAAFEEPANRDRLIEALRSVAPHLERGNIRLGLETSVPAATQRDFLLELGSPWIVSYYDVANPVNKGIDPVAEIHLLGDLIGQIHFKDIRQFDGKWRETPLGEGAVDLPACVGAVKSIGYQGAIVLETPPGADAMASARANLEFTRRLFDST